ncbi:carboxypeptidase regulatory-like domain-containing protein [Tolypothrix sp. FACHB-123]|uniref:SdrD B-like domain-containing protein n=1 Tax=Tolypothrix sp. FACHB-123 TaxID=2692868 RepID=UPI0016869EF8|nr:SdrD B-like domain-containing protein [Tolypothrix sp. FACHB-123]MBD2355861.1 carboxypeptidase regulatory-like domain-containing protein [Tolypothrix sp. FACHB-123]
MVNLTLRRTIDTSRFSPASPDPSGIAYDPYTNRLVIVDGEVEEMSIFQGSNVFELGINSTQTAWDRRWSTTSFSDEPTGVDIYFNPNNPNDPLNGRMLISDDDQREIYIIDPINGIYGDAGDSREILSTRGFGSGDPEGVAWGPNGTIFVLDGVNAEVYQIDRLSGEVINQFDTASLGIRDPEGIDYNPLTNSIYIIGEPINTIAEISTTGNLIRNLTISAPGLLKPAGLTIAPTSNDPNSLSIYVADRGVDNDSNPNENDGKIFEFTLPPPPTGADLELTQTVSNPTPKAGDTVTFTLTLRNRGPENATSIQVKNYLPAGFTFQGNPSQGTYNSTTGVWTVNALNSDSTATLSLVTTVQNTPSNLITNTAEVIASSKADPDSTPNNNNPNEDDQASATFGPQVITREIRINASSDDAEQKGTSVDIDSSDLELVNDGSNQTVGLRFNNIIVPKGVIITNAYIQFKADETSTDATNLLIQGEATDNATTFTTVSNNISSRSRTSASVAWNPADWSVVGAAGTNQRTSNIAAIVQEIINRPGWQSGNSIATIITGTGKRVAEAFEGDALGAPLLRIEYIEPTAPLGSIGDRIWNDANGNGIQDTGESGLTGVTVKLLSGSNVLGTQVTGANGTYTFSNLQAGTYKVEVVQPSGYTQTGDPDTNKDNSSQVTLAAGQNNLNQDFGYQLSAGGSIGDRIWNDANGNGVQDTGESGLTGVTVKLLSGSNVLGTQTTGANGTYTFSNLQAGTYTVEVDTNTLPTGVRQTGDPDSIKDNKSQVTLTAGQNNLTQDFGYQFSTAPTVIQVRVANSSDDAEQSLSGSMSLTSTDLELIRDGSRDQLVGLRFVGVNIPQGANITNAYIQFKVDELTSVATNLTIRGQDADNAATFTTTRGDISSRLLTDANAVWNSVPTWNTMGAAGVDQRTPNLAAVIQEIVNRPGWSSGNALATIISGTGERVAESFDGDRLGAPLLHVEFTV